MSYSESEHEARRALRSDLLDELNDCPQADSTSYQSISAGGVALGRALEQWAGCVLEPLDEVADGPILERYIQKGIGWTWQTTYKNRAFAWCGAFAAWAWRDSVSLSIRKKRFASTYRLQQWAKDSDRIIDSLEDARAGDIIIVGHKKKWGDHITLFERSAEEGGYWSVEGNAFGEVPNYRGRGEGVIRRRRSTSEIFAIYRPLEADR